MEKTKTLSLRLYVALCYLITVFVPIFIPGIVLAYVFKLLRFRTFSNRIINFLAISWISIFLFLTGRKLEFFPNGLNLDGKKRFMICNHTNGIEAAIFVSVPYFAKSPNAMLTYLGSDILYRLWVIPIIIYSEVVEAVTFHYHKPNFRDFKPKVMKALKDRSIILFPEGSRSYSEEIRPFMTGVLKLAYKFGVDLDIFAVSGLMGYSSAKQFTQMRKSKKIYMKYAGFIQAKDYPTFQEYLEAAQEKMTTTKKELDQLY